MRTALKWIAGVLATLVVALALFVAFGLDSLRGPITRAVTNATGRELVIDGRIRAVWSWLHPRFRVERVRFANADWAREDWLFSADAVEAEVRVLPLFAGLVVLPQVRLEGAEVNLERDEDGRQNWIPDTKTEKDEQKKNSRVRIELLTLDQGHLSYTDEALDIDLQTDLSTDATGVLFAVTGTYQGLPLSGSGHSGPVLSLRDESTPFPLKAEARVGDTRVAVDGSITGLVELKKIETRVRLSGNSLAELYDIINIALPQTPAYVTEGRLVREGTLVRYEKFTGKMGTSDISGTVQIDTGGAPFHAGRSAVQGHRPRGPRRGRRYGPAEGRRGPAGCAVRSVALGQRGRRRARQGRDDPATGAAAAAGSVHPHPDEGPRTDAEPARVRHRGREVRRAGDARRHQGHHRRQSSDAGAEAAACAALPHDPKQQGLGRRHRRAGGAQGHRQLGGADARYRERQDRLLHGRRPDQRIHDAARGARSVGRGKGRADGRQAGRGALRGGRLRRQEWRHEHQRVRVRHLRRQGGRRRHHQPEDGGDGPQAQSPAQGLERRLAQLAALRARHLQPPEALARRRAPGGEGRGGDSDGHHQPAACRAAARQGRQGRRQRLQPARGRGHEAQAAGCEGAEEGAAYGVFFRPISCIRRDSAASSFEISSPNCAAGRKAGRTPTFSALFRNSGDSTVRRIAPSRAPITARGVPWGTAMPRQASSDTSMPCSRAVGTSGRAGSRLGMSAASRRTWPCLTGADSAAGSCTTASTWPPRRLGTTCAAPKGTSFTSAPAALKSAASEMCVWLPMPEWPTLIALGFAFASGTRSLRVFQRASERTATTTDSTSTRATASKAR